MATQKEKGHGSDTPPKLQPLPGRSSNQLQGRLYSNAGRGYDREALQKMSVKAGPALVEPRTLADGSVAKASDEYNDNDDIATSSLDTSHAISQHKNAYSVQHYLLGAILFVTGILVGNVIIPAFTTTDKVAATSSQNGENASSSVTTSSTTNNTTNVTTTASVPVDEDTIDSITTITPNAETPTSGAAGCDIRALDESSKGCPIGALSTTDDKK